MAAASATDKQDKLIAAIVTGVQTAQKGEFKELTQALASMTVMLGAIQNRLEALESMQNTGAAPKRAIRTGASKAGGAKKAAEAAGDVDVSKITNGRLYCRHIMMYDVDGAREKWGTEDNLAIAASKSKTVQGRSKSDGAAYWGAVGTALWDSCLDDDQKDTVKAEFKLWKEETARAEEDNPLQEDANDQVDDDGAAE
jgi:hypothetical protein